MAKIHRTLLLKRVVQVPTDRFPALPKLELHKSMDAMFNTCTTVWDRHYPTRDKVEPGKRCVFFVRVNRPGRAVLFNAYSYVAGLTPDQAVLEDIVERISADPIETEDGVRKEIVERFCVVLLGEAMVIESARVSGSGPLVMRAIRDLVRRHTAAKPPRLDLQDAPTLDFQKMAKLHQGVSSVTARLHDGFHAQPNTFGNSLEELVSKNGFGTAKLSATIEAPEGKLLPIKEVEEMLDESEYGTGLSGITIRFGDGTLLSDLETYRERLSIEVTAVRPGAPSVNEIENEAIGYLRDLVKVNNGNFQLIDSNGLFT